ncbi:SDR family oxidoreductase [Candidatus Pelagibacter sp.]|nr:SDR family oxidoreductase [Candidatus Pelagibacter sp.]MDC3158080.1 SDR family oxidoreductase [Candidatus Pelagibacter sp.]
MKNKNIILTGSEGLLGKSYRKFAEKKGHKIFCIDIKKVNRKNYFICDITNENEVKSTIDKINSKNKIDVLINNAAFNPKAENKLKTFKFSDYNYESWKKNIEVDLYGSFLVSKHTLKYFEKRNIGNIINVSSIYGLVGPDNKIYSDKKKVFHGFKPVEYSVAKAGIIGFTKGLAAFYKGTNIRVNCIVFGGVNNNQNKKFIKKYSEKTILNRMSYVGEYNNYLEFLSSDLNSYTTGSSFIIDGGATSIF